MDLTSINPGSYGMYAANYDIHSLSDSIVHYRLDFVVTAVPEPCTWALFGMGSVLLGFATRRCGK